ncbi:helix-turn-helix transcriptional regulator [Verticiella sediminum]|uniref:Helix-turn-helix transcriptional regulator n=1 Tax=Verticiella sediminum TaxID=1247510 RepID=A0A556ALT6_9BURK|nr:helix-turn-helix transcriptional regulator [Verticiella sediminum]TSH93846.1 helix-turn-helix transcriptional regulator [Verticiella sediminum]
MVRVKPTAPLGWHEAGLCGLLTLSGGEIRAPMPSRAHEDNDAGLKVVYVLGGRLSYALPGGSPREVRGPAWHCSYSREPFGLAHEFAVGGAIRYVAVRVAGRRLHELAPVSAERLCRRAPAAPLLVDSRAGALAITLARQVLACPQEGPLRTLYLAGKAIELVTLALDALGTAADGADHLSPAEQRRLCEAREILDQQLDDPPTLHELAGALGMNATRLSQGFQRLFGRSVYAHVREARLQLAYEMLREGRMRVGDAAHRCGYTDSYFTKVFKQRFGVLPSDLR